MWRWPPWINIRSWVQVLWIIFYSSPGDPWGSAWPDRGNDGPPDWLLHSQRGWDCLLSHQTHHIPGRSQHKLKSINMKSSTFLFIENKFCVINKYTCINVYMFLCFYVLCCVKFQLVHLCYAAKTLISLAYTMEGLVTLIILDIISFLILLSSIWLYISLTPPLPPTFV